MFLFFPLKQEAGRYPAYKEMVAEYGWLDQCMLTLKSRLKNKNFTVAVFPAH